MQKYKMVILIQTVIAIMLFILGFYIYVSSYVSKYYTDEYLTVLSDRIIILLENDRVPQVLEGLKRFKNNGMGNRDDNFTELLNYFYVECNKNELKSKGYESHETLPQ